VAPRVWKICAPVSNHCSLQVCGHCSPFAVCPIWYTRFSYNCYLRSLRIGLRSRRQRVWLWQHVDQKTVLEKHFLTSLWYIATNMYEVIVTLLCVLSTITLHLMPGTCNSFFDTVIFVWCRVLSLLLFVL
jgi:hypothetical protein